MYRILETQRSFIYSGVDSSHVSITIFFFMTVLDVDIVVVFFLYASCCPCCRVLKILLHCPEDCRASSPPSELFTKSPQAANGTDKETLLYRSAGSTRSANSVKAVGRVSNMPASARCTVVVCIYLFISKVSAFSAVV